MEHQRQSSRDPFGDETNRRPEPIGVGKPFELVDRRDFTVKASRRPAPGPPHTTPPTTVVPLPSSAPHSATSFPTFRRPTHRYTNSTPTFSIVTPQYVRSQPLSRANSLSDRSPTVSGGVVRRESVTSLSESEDDGADRPRRLRSDSLPRFPISVEEDAEAQAERRREQLQRDVDALPPHPRLWLPSHLSLYITHSLSLHPRLAEDITAFIIKSRLGGRTFLRLREKELHELGMSTPWVEAMLKAQEQLRQQASFGPMWGFEGSALATSDSPSCSPDERPLLKRRPSVEVEGSDLEEERGKEEWKKSWRSMQGAASRGRVRGIAHAFEKVEEGSREGTPDCSPIKRRPTKVTIEARGDQSTRLSRIGIFPQSPYPPIRGRSDSTSSSTSTASIDSGSGADSFKSGEDDDTGEYRTPSSFSSRSLAQQLEGRADSIPSQDSAPKAVCDPDHGASPPPPTFLPTPFDTPESYQSNITSHARPYGLVRRPSEKRPAALAERDDGEQEERTVRVSSEGATSAADGRRGLGELFGFELPSSGSAREGVEEVVELEVGARGGKKGSMVMVKRSQLAALSKRMAEVETQVALAQGSSIAPSEVGDSELEELEKRLQSIESFLPLSAPLTPARSVRSDSHSSFTNDLHVARRVPTHSQILSTWVTSSLTTLSLSDLATSSHDSARQLMDHSGSLMSWTALGGYCVMAGLGIGIVAGEVVVAKLFGIRRR